MEMMKALLPDSALMLIARLHSQLISVILIPMHADRCNSQQILLEGHVIPWLPSCVLCFRELETPYEVCNSQVRAEMFLMDDYHNSSVTHKEILRLFHH